MHWYASYKNAIDIWSLKQVLPKFIVVLLNEYLIKERNHSATRKKTEEPIELIKV